MGTTYSISHWNLSIRATRKRMSGSSLSWKTQLTPECRRPSPNELKVECWTSHRTSGQPAETMDGCSQVGPDFNGVQALSYGHEPPKREGKELVVSEVTRQEEETYKISAVSQQHQGKWTTWKAVTTYDTLPSLRNLQQRYGSETNCHLCNTPNPSLQYILTGCKEAWNCYRWRHDRVLRKLAGIVEVHRLKANKTSRACSQQRIQFIRQRVGVQNTSQREWSILAPGSKWKMRVDLNWQLQLPHEITVTSLRPDIVLWSTSTRAMIMAELIYISSQSWLQRFHKIVPTAIPKDPQDHWVEAEEGTAVDPTAPAAVRHAEMPCKQRCLCFKLHPRISQTTSQNKPTQQPVSGGGCNTALFFLRVFTRRAPTKHKPS